MFVNAYSPRSFVTVFRAMLVRSLVRVTSTPGMTPPESLMDPRKPPWNPCPNAVLEVMTARNAPSKSPARNLMVPSAVLWIDRSSDGILECQVPGCNRRVVEHGLPAALASPEKRRTKTQATETRRHRVLPVSPCLRG